MLLIGLYWRGSRFLRFAPGSEKTLPRSGSEEVRWREAA